jgi:hypothetical protein
VVCYGASVGGTCRRELRAWLENLSDTVLNVEEKVVNKPLNICLSMRSRECAKTCRKQPHMEVRHCEPRLKRRRKMAFYHFWRSTKKKQVHPFIR